MVCLPHNRYYYQGQPTLEASWQAGFNSISSVGQFFGGFACSWLADRVGRKGALLGGLLLVSGGIFGEVFSNTNGAFLVSKLILGVGLGFYLTISVLYASEISPVVLRGITTASINLAIVIGQFLSNAAIKGFGAREDTWAYRGPFMIQLIFVGGSRLPFYALSGMLSNDCSYPSSWTALRPGITMVLCPERPTGQGSGVACITLRQSRGRWP